MKVCPVCGRKYPDTNSLCSVDAALLKNVDDPLVGRTLAGKYLIERLIKRGGMGAVYRGKHVLMDKTVAIKVLRPSLSVDDQVVARFSREAKAASRISHPHAVNVTDFGEAENGIVFLVMEYLDGRTLKEIIKSEGRLEVARAVEIIRQVTGALDAAHQQGVVHRDLKSDNIMLSQTNGGDWAKVLDFGIAKIQLPEGFHDADITAPNLVVGTPQYMSPEQCSQSGPIDARSDVYSLGVIVYEMLSGRVPFTGESPTVIMMKQVQDPPPSILSACPDLPAGIESVLTKALAKQPADRFQSAGELSEALTRASEIGDAALSTTKMPIVEPVRGAPAAVDDLDEETIVRPREEVVVGRSRQEIPIPGPRVDERPALSNFNPWQVIISAVVVMAVVFGGVYLLTRSTGPGQTAADQTGGQQQPQTGLVADPNSQPVQATSPPIGESEQNIQPQPTASPLTVSPNVNANANANANKQGQVAPGEVTGNFGENANANANTGRGNKNANQPREAPTPKSSPSVEKKETPPPKPSPSIKTVAKPTPTP